MEDDKQKSTIMNFPDDIRSPGRRRFIQGMLGGGGSYKENCLGWKKYKSHR